MPFKLIIDSLDDVEESLRSSYKPFKAKGPDGKETEKFALDVEDDPANHPKVATLKNAFERQKAENATIKEKLAAEEAKAKMPEGLTVEEIDRLKAVDEEVKKGNNPDAKKIHDAEVQSIKNMHQQELARKDKAIGDLKAEHTAALGKKDTTISNLLIGQGLTKALSEAGVSKGYMKAATAMLEKSVKVIDSDTGPQAVFETDLGEVPIDQFVPQWAQSDEGKLFIPAPSGSDSSGNKNRRDGSGPNPFSKENWNLTEQGQLIREDAAKADRLAKAAGHKQAAGAKRENAK
jgi:hypothetical protein